MTPPVRRPQPPDPWVPVDVESGTPDKPITSIERAEAPPPPVPSPKIEPNVILEPTDAPPIIGPTAPRPPIAPGSGEGPLGPGFGQKPILTTDQLDRIPRALSRIPPTYPREMQSAAIGGTVTVEFTVDSAGSVISAYVVSSSRHDFEEAAVRAVLHWRFEPGRRNGRIVPFRMAIPINFTPTTT
ncbi:MAG TPA: TonB family protein [Candidatus Didemnitutus sp.]|nr:TonB family protein [Candidatus Didemnitutus sp.]